MSAGEKGRMTRISDEKLRSIIDEEMIEARKIVDQNPFMLIEASVRAMARSIVRAAILEISTLLYNDGTRTL